MTRNLFTSATLKLTAWYLVLLMVVSLLFSVVLYTLSNDQLRRGLRAPDDDGPGYGRLVDNEFYKAVMQQRLKEGREQVMSGLVVFNIVVLGTGGMASYLLARRTLRPIHDVLEAQTRFSSDAAHELRTPLAVMQTEIEVALRDKKASKQSHTEVLASNLDEVHRLRTLTDRLLLLAGNEELPLSVVSVEGVVMDAATRAIPLAQAKDISVENNVRDAKVVANDEALGDVLTVLIDNAVKYSPKKSTVRLESKVTEKYVTLSVHDEGVGIDPSEHSKVFERFYRVDSSRSKLVVEGHGLGLSLAKRLIELQKGSISVASDGKQGSAFSIKLRRASK